MLKKKFLVALIIVSSGLKASNFKIINMTNYKAQVDLSCKDVQNAEYNANYIIQAHDVVGKNSLKFPIEYEGMPYRYRAGPMRRGGFTCNKPESISKITMKEYVNKNQEINRPAIYYIPDTSPEIGTLHLPNFNFEGTYVITQKANGDFEIEEVRF